MAGDATADRAAETGRPDDRPGRKALAALDRVLAHRPKKDDHAFSQATLCLTAFRDELIEGHRRQACTRERLTHLNGVLSVVLAGHFPLGDVPWSELDKARGWLSDLLDAVEPD
ncbi:hypothetical protein U8607_13530 [Methylobacterium durans]|uniref:hypothetical protein n=1 Tax=Methylobacterium durans TaxID=2202825 RepID=UPI002AFEE2C1|nr:hypothetical protein [Methylobacterium durans]MEA1833102.1 hypothetical protein [Methylobacterium durans]